MTMTATSVIVGVCSHSHTHTHTEDDTDSQSDATTTLSTFTQGNENIIDFVTCILETQFYNIKNTKVISIHTHTHTLGIDWH